MVEYTRVSELQEEGLKKLEKLTLTVSECSKITGIGENKLRELIHTQDFPVIWNGNRALILKDQIGDWLKANIGKRF